MSLRLCKQYEKLYSGPYMCLMSNISIQLNIIMADFISINKKEKRVILKLKVKGIKIHYLLLFKNKIYIEYIYNVLN